VTLTAGEVEMTAYQKGAPTFTDRSEGSPDDHLCLVVLESHPELGSMQ
jgi:hypothetical protein